MISQSKMDFWIRNNYNVLFIGKHGIGKTQSVIEAFERAHIKWKYFSTSTMDPWVDLIGVPKEKQDDEGEYLQLVRPKEFARDEIEAIFFDEFSRSHKKIRNAVMELIQFKSINGKKFDNLRFVWAAINPDDDEEVKYDVEELDKAQKDRFQIHVELPYTCSLPYFKKIYGEQMAVAAVQWWKDLPDKVKNEVSPRRLDFALDVFRKKGDMHDVLPHEANVSKLVTELTYGSLSVKLKELYENQDKEAARQFLAIENNYGFCIDKIVELTPYANFFIPLLSSEKISSLICKHERVLNMVLERKGEFSQILEQIVQANQNKKVVRKITKTIGIKTNNYSTVPSKDVANCNINPLARTCKVSSLASDYSPIITTIATKPMGNTLQRWWVFDSIKDTIQSNISKEHAVQILRILTTICCRSHGYTLNRNTTAIISIVNFCLRTIVASGIPDLRDILAAYPDIRAVIEFSMKHKKLFLFNFSPK